MGPSLVRPNWWNTTGFVLTLIGIATLGAIFRRMNRAVLGTGITALLLVVLRVVGFVVEYPPSQFWDQLVYRSASLALPALGGVVLVWLAWHDAAGADRP